MSGCRPRSYAVLWRFGEGQVCAGRLEIGEGAIALTGRTCAGDPSGATVVRGQITGLRIGRGLPERIHGRPALVLERHEAETLLIAEAIGIGGLNELADRLTAPPVTAIAP